jgi:hypothetical protein
MDKKPDEIETGKMIIWEKQEIKRKIQRDIFPPEIFLC